MFKCNQNRPLISRASIVTVVTIPENIVYRSLYLHTLTKQVNVFIRLHTRNMEQQDFNVFRVLCIWAGWSNAWWRQHTLDQYSHRMGSCSRVEARVSEASSRWKTGLERSRPNFGNVLECGCRPFVRCACGTVPSVEEDCSQRDLWRCCREAEGCARSLSFHYIGRESHTLVSLAPSWAWRNALCIHRNLQK